MRYLIFALLLVPTIVLAQEPKLPLDPTDTVKQLYHMSSRSYGGAASYEIWGDGSVHFYVEAPGNGRNNVRLHGRGSTPEQALSDLKSQSELVAKTLVPEAEAKKNSVLSVLESIKALLFGDRRSQ